MTETLVVDYAWSHPSLAALKTAGYSGIARYLSPDASKNLTVAEVAQARALGMSINVVWESSANRALAGANAGGADGVLASHQATALGFPAGLPIFAAVDFGASSAQLSAIGAYLVAFGKATGRPVGVYGSALVVDHFVGNGVAKFGWQTVAWSGGVVSHRAHLYQRASKTRPAVAGSYDENVALAANFGQWAAAPIPTPVADVTTRRFAMLVFALGSDYLFATAFRHGVVTQDVTEAKAAIARGEVVKVLGGPAATALGLSAGQHGNTQVIIGATFHDTAVAAAALMV